MSRSLLSSNKPGIHLSQTISVTTTLQLLSLVATVAMTPLQLSGMGSNQYGLVVIAAAIANYVSYADLGGAWAVMRYVPFFRSQGMTREANEAFTIATIASASVGILCTLAIWVIAPTLGHIYVHSPVSASRTLTSTIRVAGFWVPITLLTGVFTGVGRVLGRIQLMAVLSSGGTIIFNICWLAIALNTRSAYQVVFCQLIISTALLLVVSLTVMSSDQVPHFTLVRRQTPAWQLLAFSAWGTLVQLSIGVLTSGDKVILSLLVGPSALVYYAIPFSLTQRLTLLSSSAVSVIFPGLASASSRGLRSSETLLRHSSRMVLVPTLALASLGIWAGPAAVSLWLSPTFASRSEVAVVALSIGFGFASIGSVYQAALEAIGRVRHCTWITAGIAMPGLGLLFVFGVVFGTNGAAIAMAVALTSISLAMIASSLRSSILDRRELRSLGRTAVVLTVPCAISHFLLILLLRNGLVRSLLEVALTVGILVASSVVGYRSYVAI